jgi:S-adenosylmethionine:tRNA ribosyltransferase-isomerase
MEKHGDVPLPPYIRRLPEDPRAEQDLQRYQTVFARARGAVAAPTAGLHFTRRLLDEVAARGVEVATVTLHVGPGTFRPVTADQAEDHRVDAEQFEVSPAAAAAIRRTRERQGRVIACGTTVVRTLESRAGDDGNVQPGAGLCDLYILPGHRFRVVDGLITNFHLPRSSLLMLVSALAGRERVLSAYHQAVAAGYRFYSYGDAMFIPPESRVSG